MPEPPYRALSILLRVFSLLAAVGGLLLIFAEKPLIVRMLLRPPEGEVSTLFLSILKKMGGMVLMLGDRCGLRHAIPCATWPSWTLLLPDSGYWR
jgi:hypothetical protein